MALTGLAVSHFRSHKVVRIDVRPGPIAIFGRNGAGKTNLIEAVSLMSPGRGLRRSSAFDMARRPEGLGWKVSGILHSKNQAHEIETWSEAGASRQVRIDGKSTTQVALGNVARVLWLIPAMDRLWIEGADGRRRFLDRAALSLFPDHAEHALTYEKSMRERNRLLKDQVRDGHWYVALERQMAESGLSLHRNRTDTVAALVRAQSSAATAFPAASLELVSRDEPMPGSVEDLRTALSDTRMRDLAAQRTLIGPHRSDLDAVFDAKSVPAKDCSTGEQKALLISLILANARALQQDFGAPPILLLDEVAAHLDAQRRNALYDEICALGAQAWMTGTGPELFADLGTRADYLEVCEDGGTSEVRTVTDLGV